MLFMRYIRQILFITVVGIFIINGGNLFSQESVTLDEAIEIGAMDVELGLSQGTRVVVLNFSSSSPRLSNYVINEMMNLLVRNKKVTVVNRSELELIQQEMNFQMSGEVSDRSAQFIGQKVGAQSIVSGSIEEMSRNDYRVRFRTIAVETAVMQASSSLNVKWDTRIAALMGVSDKKGNTTQPSATAYNHGLNFSTGRKVGAGFLNMLFGIGSFSMRDIGGGFLVGGLELAGYGLMVTGIVMMPTYDWGNNYDPTTGKSVNDDYDKNYSRSMIMMFGGSGVVFIGWVTGFARPFAYDKRLAKKNGTYFAFGGNPLDNISITPVSTSDGPGIGLIYSASF